MSVLEAAAADGEAVQWHVGAATAGSDARAIAGLVDVMTACLSFDRTARPKMDDVMNLLEHLLHGTRDGACSDGPRLCSVRRLSGAL